MSALFHNDFDRLLRERIQSHGGVDVHKEEKVEEARDLSSRIADKEEVQPSQILQGSEQ